MSERTTPGASRRRALLERARADIVLVDFDDTIVDTGPRFQRARRALVEQLVELGFDADSAQRVHHHEIDPLMRQQYGLGPRRMEHSFRETYLALCTQHGRAPVDELVLRFTELGRSAFGVPPAFDGAIAALARLAAAVPTVVYTQSGDPEYQQHCVREAGVVAVVTAARVRVCARKDAAMFRDTLRYYGVTDPAGAWMIGNSIRSDINPALEAGANAILVETVDPWEYDLVEPAHHRFERVRSLPAAVDLLLG